MPSLGAPPAALLLLAALSLARGVPRPPLPGPPELCGLEAPSRRASPPHHPYGLYPGRAAQGVLGAAAPGRPRGRRPRGAGGGGEEERGEAEGRPRGRAPQVPSPPRARPLPALYFSGGRETLAARPEALPEVPRERFTLELWVKAEGGQSNPAVIAGVFDNCSHTASDKGWALGIRALRLGGKKDARFFFSLRTDRATAATEVTGSHRYRPDTWTHLAASYDGHWMSLYVDGARVGRAGGQRGPLHSTFMASCRTLLLGGDAWGDAHTFRGHLAGLALWQGALPQPQLQRPFLEEAALGVAPVLAAGLDAPEQRWAPFREGSFPRRQALLPPAPPILRPLGPPACGQTACDNVDLVSHYNQHWPLRGAKAVRYRVVSLQVWRQHRALSDAFRPYNISWQLSLLEVRNSSLRRRAVLLGCEPSKVGNERCDPECEHPLTGYDGGDCRRPGRCFSWKRRDGVCHMECNNMLDDFDDGDCCDPHAADVGRTCFDPDSPQRVYMSVKELKEALQLNSTHFLNVYFASSVREELAGAATWPWDKEALSHLGGVVLNPAYYGMHGHTNTMIHEVGHVLGLYHVFKGVSERESCDDPCRETTPSMETGDLCADTAPTPKSKLCRDPDPTNDTCGQMHFTGTPFNNYMSYTDDDCTNTFTPNQVARMHCYLDLVYQRWSQSKKPAPIPIPPMVTGQTQDSLSIYWLPPISGVIHERELDTLCDDCAEDGTFRQYVHEASSPRVCDSSGYWTPEEAEGPPDVDQPCEPSLQAWSPELHLYHMNMTVPCPQPDGCILELRFLHPVYPDSLTLWTTYLSTDSPKALSDIEILTEQGESIHLGPLDTFCDVPFTVKLNIHKKVSGIDTALLTSMPHSSLCSSCKLIQYRVLREPPFADGSPATAAQAHREFVDTEVMPGQVYRYQVQAVSGTTLGEASPPLVHVHGAPYCGDGKVTAKSQGQMTSTPPGRGAACACSLVCKQGILHLLAGEPSLCYVHDGDGVCEPFEKTSSVLDCGPYTPNGYVDLWAAKAYASHQDEKSCPASLATGEPVKDTRISQALSPRPRGRPGIPQGTKWLPTSILVFLASDGTAPSDQHKPRVTVQLSNVEGLNRSLGEHRLSCQHNPLIIDATRGQQDPSYRAGSVLLNFSSPLIGIAAVALRTGLLADPVPLLLRSCAHGACAGLGSCTKPPIAHTASMNCTSDGPRHMECSITCEKGFVLRSTSLSPQQDVVLTCSSGRWDRSVTCDPVDCGVPDQSHVYYAKFSCPKGTTYLKRCSFSCVHPAKLQGMNQWLTCLEDGLWSLPEAYCKLECDAPPAVPNAKLLVPRCLQGNHDVGSVCRYKCKPGYHVAENAAGKPKKKFLKIQCLESGQWEEGHCVPVVCEPPPPVFEGMYNCTQGFELDSQCVLNCEPPGVRVSDGDRGRSVPIVCTKEGSWTEEFTLCESLQGTCPPPPELNLVEYKCEQGHGIGESRLKLSEAVVVAALPLPPPLTAVFSSPPQHIVCTGRLRWYPDPSGIHCIQSCETGWCDTINNRAYCQYDGGDCCSSTLSSRKVSTRPCYLCAVAEPGRASSGLKDGTMGSGMDTGGFPPWVK
uniref:Pappalysin 2 n=1 Tax=Anas platyrhynchos TaxID=8839 RepID=A0A8B9TR62_ANAPL